jgi:hypothetical protein
MISPRRRRRTVCSSVTQRERHFVCKSFILLGGGEASLPIIACRVLMSAEEPAASIVRPPSASAPGARWPTRAERRGGNGVPLAPHPGAVPVRRNSRSVQPWLRTAIGPETTLSPYPIDRSLAEDRSHGPAGTDNKISRTAVAWEIMNMDSPHAKRLGRGAPRWRG